ncbi:substrate-binding domain-containing protein [Acidicapsa acidisoli]|uniref:substrate-binding domain-containing protein n=1 Tax=Acidicapsa acidisoli TaxID=1615681 RepID=UPI0021DF871D|nr:substrate-binding domain-containing protein [Acidicapsa acidisoli]
MPSVRKLVAFALTPTLLLLTSCARHSQSEVYYLVATNMSLSYWKTAVTGFNAAATRYKVTAKIAGPDNYDPQAELQELNKAVAAKPAGILISVADESLLKPGIDAAVEAGVPVITMDSDAATSRRLFFIGTNNVAAGRLGGQRIVEKLGGRGNVVFFSMPGQPNLDERLQGFKDIFATHPDIKILDVVNIKGDARNAFDNTEQYLTQTGIARVAAFICLEASSGKTVADAVRRQKATDRVVLAWDVEQDTLGEIKDGTIEATISQKPYTMGFVGLKELDEIFHNKPRSLTKDYSVDAFSEYPVFIDTGTALVDKANVDIYAKSAAEHQQ